MIALSDMSTEALVRELRIAQARGLSERVKRIKFVLATRRKLAYTQAPPTQPAKHWSERDD